MRKPAAHREHVVSVRLSEDEHRLWLDESRNAGYGQMARWARETVNRQIEDRLGGAETDPRDLEPQLVAPLREHTRALNKIARLLSELVTNGQVVNEEDLRRIERAVLMAGRTDGETQA